VEETERSCAMRHLVDFGGGSGIYDDGGNDWLLTGGVGGVARIKKKDQPLYPLAAVLKWGAKPVDVAYLNALSDGGLVGVQRFLRELPR